MPKAFFALLLIVMAQSVSAGNHTGQYDHDNGTVSAQAQHFAQGTISIVKNPAYNQKKLKTQVPYRQMGTSLIVDGMVNGIKVTFIVDTGASFVVIPPALARRARINTKGATLVTLQTANGKVRVPLVRIRSLKVGGLTRSDILCVVHNISADGQIGLLGMSFLATYRMTVDQERRLLVLEAR